MSELVLPIVTLLVLSIGFIYIVSGLPGTEWYLKKITGIGYYLLKESVLGARMIIASLFHYIADLLQPADMKGKKKKKKKP
jgi:hypothetical protein